MSIAAIAAEVVLQHADQPTSTRFIPLVPFQFGGRSFDSGIECVQFTTTKYKWIVQLQPGSALFAKEPL